MAHAFVDVLVSLWLPVCMFVCCGAQVVAQMCSFMKQSYVLLILYMLKKGKDICWHIYKWERADWNSNYAGTGRKWVPVLRVRTGYILTGMGGHRNDVTHCTRLDACVFSIDCQATCSPQHVPSVASLEFTARWCAGFSCWILTFWQDLTVETTSIYWTLSNSTFGVVYVIAL